MRFVSVVFWEKAKKYHKYIAIAHYLNKREGAPKGALLFSSKLANRIEVKRNNLF